MNSHQIESFLLLTLLSLTYSTSLRRVERLRRAVALDRVPDMLGVWTFAAVMLLPPPLIVAAVIVVDLGEWPSRKAVQNGRPLKYAVSSLGLAAACVVAAQVLHNLPAVLGIPAALITFCSLNVGIVAALIRASGRRDVLRMFADPRAHITELCTQALGAALGLAMHWHQPAAVVALPILLTLHLSALRHTVKETEAFDSTTGLWTEEAWTIQAQDLINAGPCALVMVIDAPYSERRMIADVIRGPIREKDLLGTYDHDKIAVVSPVGAAVSGRLIAQRVKNSLDRSGACYHMGSCATSGEDLQSMLMVALTDLMTEREGSRSAR